MAFARPQYDVVLVNPPAEVIRERWDMPPYPQIGLAYVGNYLEAHGGITPAIIDGKLGRLTPEQVVDQVVALRPRVVGVTAMTHMIAPAARLCAAIRERLPEVVFICGGFHATFMPEQTRREFPVFDYIICGEGEIAFLELVKAILEQRDFRRIAGLCWQESDGAIRWNGRGTIGPTLDSFGEPGWHLFDPAVMEAHCRHLPVMTMRGCPFSCNFCSRPYGQKVRKRTPALVLDEIQRNMDRFPNVNYTPFYDETFTVDKRHTLELCRGMVERGLNKRMSWDATMHANTADLEMIQAVREANCAFLWFGVESGNDEIMRKMKKNVTKERILRAAALCRQVGQPFSSCFIIGHPNETFWTALDSIKFAVKINATETPIGVMVPYPGTEVWDMAVKGEGGYKRLSTNWEDFSKQAGRAVELAGLKRWQMQMLQLGGYVAIYLLNGRFRELFSVPWRERRLVWTILKQVVSGMFRSRRLAGDTAARGPVQ